MPNTFVLTPVTAGTGGTSSTITCTVPAGVTIPKGALMVLRIAANTGSVVALTGVSDPHGSGFTTAVSQPDTTSTQSVHMITAVAAAAYVTGDAIVFTFGSNQSTRWRFDYIANAVLDATAARSRVQTLTTPFPTGHTITPTTAALIMGVMCCSSQPHVWTPSSPATLVKDSEAQVNTASRWAVFWSDPGASADGEPAAAINEQGNLDGGVSYIDAAITVKAATSTTPVGASLVQPSGIRQLAGSSLAQPSLVKVAVGRSAAQPYAVAAAVAPQVARPQADVTRGAWNSFPTAGQPLFAEIDETVEDTSDYIFSSLSPATADVCEVRLTAVSDPQVSFGHVVQFAYQKDQTGGDRIDLTVRLMQGATEIANTAIPNIDTHTAGSLTLTKAQADAITDYSDLRLRFEAVKV